MYILYNRGIIFLLQKGMYLIFNAKHKLRNFVGYILDLFHYSKEIVFLNYPPNNRKSN